MCKHIYNPDQTYPKGTPFTYFIGWSKLNIFYYGVKFAKDCHPDDLWKTYFTSSPPLKEFRKLNGEPDIVRVDFIFDTTLEARAYEEFILKKNDHARNPNWLNLSNGGKNFCVTEESIKKTAAGLLGKTQSDETKKKRADSLRGRSSSNKGKKRTPEQCKQMGDAKRGIPLSEDHKQNLRKPKKEGHGKNVAAARRGTKRTPETCQKIRNSLTGRTLSEEHCQNISKGNIGKHNIPCSKEKKLLLSELNSGKKRPIELVKKTADALRGRPKSNEHKQNLSKARKGTFMINNGEIQIFVFPEEAELLFPFGFLIGTLKKRF